MITERPSESESAQYDHSPACAEFILNIHLLEGLKLFREDTLPLSVVSFVLFKLH